MQLVPVVAIGITVVAVSAEAMRGVLVQSETMCANVTIAAARPPMCSPPPCRQCGLRAKAAAHMAAATEATAVTTATTTAAATTAGVGRARQQA